MFEDIVLSWEGKDYTIKADNVMGAIARIEAVMTLKELSGYAANQDVPLAKLSMAFGAVLRYAGANVKDQDVYAGMFKADTQGSIMAAIETLLMMMIPPSALEQEEPPGKSRGTSKTAGRKSSRKRTR